MGLTACSAARVDGPPPADVLTETLIATHYGATIDVVPVGDRIAVIPRRRL